MKGEMNLEELQKVSNESYRKLAANIIIDFGSLGCSMPGVSTLLAKWTLEN